MSALASGTAMPVVLSAQQAATRGWVRKGRGSLILKSRAGTGKSFTIVHGICRTIYDEQPKAEVAVMAYNKSAGDEMVAKLAEAGMVVEWTSGPDGRRVAPRIEGGTVHSFGFKYFRKMAPNVRVDDKKVTKIIAARFTDPATKKADEDHPFFVCRNAIRKTVSMAKQMAFGVLKSIDDDGAWCALVEDFELADELPDGYAARDLIRFSRDVLRASFAADFDVIDFDDMVIAPLVHKARIWGKDYVVMDEAQDTNPARRALAFAMLKRGGRFVAVGDDRQAIYRFTGADSDSLDIIERAMNAETLMLTQTRRCPKAVVELAKALVPDYEALDDAPEGSVRSVPYFSVGIESKGPAFDPQPVEIPWFRGEGLGAGDAILCRNTKPLIEEAYSLIRNGVGCVVEGRDIGSNLEALATRWTRIKTVGALEAKLEDFREREVAKHMAKGNEEKAEAAEDRIDCLKMIVEKVRSEGGSLVSDVVAAIRRLFGDAEEGAEVVTLCTLHRSKGREWQRVYHLGRAKLLPSRHARKAEDLRQEENLEYVGYTRAKSEYVDVEME